MKREKKVGQKSVGGPRFGRLRYLMFQLLDIIPVANGLLIVFLIDQQESIKKWRKVRRRRRRRRKRQRKRERERERETTTTMIDPSISLLSIAVSFDGSLKNQQKFSRNDRVASFDHEEVFVYLVINTVSKLH